MAKFVSGNLNVMLLQFLAVTYDERKTVLASLPTSKWFTKMENGTAKVKRRRIRGKARAGENNQRFYRKSGLFFFFFKTR